MAAAACASFNQDIDQDEMSPLFLLFEVNEQRVLDDREAGAEGNYFHGDRAAGKAWRRAIRADA